MLKKVTRSESLKSVKSCRNIPPRFPGNASESMIAFWHSPTDFPPRFAPPISCSISGARMNSSWSSEGPLLSPRTSSLPSTLTVPIIPSALLRVFNLSRLCFYYSRCCPFRRCAIPVDDYRPRNCWLLLLLVEPSVPRRQLHILPPLPPGNNLPLVCYYPVFLKKHRLLCLQPLAYPRR